MARVSFPLSEEIVVEDRAVHPEALQALSLAGGRARFASDESIKIIRREGAKKTAIPFDYSVASGVANTVLARLSPTTFPPGRRPRSGRWLTMDSLRLRDG